MGRLAAIYSAPDFTWTEHFDMVIGSQDVLDAVRELHAILNKHERLSRPLSILNVLQTMPGIQKVDEIERFPLALALVDNATDATDENLTLMVWYGIEPLVAADLGSATALAGKAKNPLDYIFD